MVKSSIYECSFVQNRDKTFLKERTASCSKKKKEEQLLSVGAKFDHW